MYNIKILLIGFLIYFSLFEINDAQKYRALNGINNNLKNPTAGSSGVIYLNVKNVTELFADPTIASMLTCPHNYQAVVLPVVDKCTDVLPVGNSPLPRCISDINNGIQSTQLQKFNEVFVDSLKSKRKSSHMMTFWADFLSFDIAYSQNTEVLNDAILIPSDDTTYLSENTQGFTQISQTTLPFSRSYNILSRGTVNLATAYVDGSNIYGTDETRLNEVLRDPNNRCKMMLMHDESPDGTLGHLPRDANGNHIYAQANIRGNMFVDMIYSVFLREHNKKCDELRGINGNNWDDETYFQEAKKWVVALIQKITYLEYLSILTGVPLPEFTGYNPDLTPGVDLTFVTTTMRYGHSEVSDNYNIVNQDGELITTLSLHQLNTHMEIFGVPAIAASLALQRQESMDIFYSDYMRATRLGPNVLDMASIDNLRVRDRGVPYYNDVRELYGFSRAGDFSDITKNVVVQERLKKLYTSVDKVEALIGGLAEDHYNNSNLGPLFQKSIQEQFTLLRDADRYWFESPDAGFSRKDIEEIRNTTWRDVILRNTPEGTKLPDNIWFVQPRNDLTPSKPDEDQDDKDADADGYPRENLFQISQIYSMKWKIEQPYIYLKMTLASENAWFGVGFNSKDGGMLGADFLIVYNVRNDIQVGSYKSNGYEPPIIRNVQFVEKLSGNVTNGSIEVEVRRPLDAPDTAPIKNDTTPMIFAWNPNSNVLSYHGGNRGESKINFFEAGISTAASQNRRTLLFHGLWMFATWSVIFPVSIIIVRYMKHSVHHLSQHKSLQIVGGVGVFTFGAAALAVANEQARTSHKIVGIVIYTGVVFQLGLGLLSAWAKKALVSSNHGIFKLIKVAHFLLGTALMVTAAFNVYLGIDTYGETKDWQKAYFAWVGLLVIVFIVMEGWYTYRNRKRCFGNASMDGGGGIIETIRQHYPDKKIPPVSWDGLNQRILQGAKLVVVDNYIFDIRIWINAHPGGSKLLKHVIGTDITSDFFEGHNKNLVIPKKSVGKPVLQNGFGLVNCFERINNKYANKTPGHEHSKFAAVTLASMVIGKISDPSKRDSELFKRYVLVHKEVVTGDDPVDPVRLFTFLDPNNNLSTEFLPGDYIEILGISQGMVTIRQYTVLHNDIAFISGKFKPSPGVNYFSIMVKLYKDGIMSNYLDRKIEGLEIKIRGPFSINRRIEHLQRPPPQKLTPVLSEKEKEDSQPTTQSTENNVLLNSNSNSEDRCWDYLFMICRGTGITPMIQLIEYHIERIKDNERKVQLFLLFENRSESDIIHQIYLNHLIQKSKFKLRISYVLTEIPLNPPSSLSGLQKGPIDHRIIFEWLSKHYIPDAIIGQQTYEQAIYFEALKNDSVAFRLCVCGSPIWMASINNTLSQLGFPTEKAKFVD